MGDLKIFINEVKSLVESGEAENKGDEFWIETGSRVLNYIDSIVESGKANPSTPRDYDRNDCTILETLFHTLAYMPNPNQPFKHNREGNMISFYELAYSRCCSYVCQLLSDRFPYVQKLLIKKLFCQPYICSLLASDVYVFIIRIVHPNQRALMCQIIMNLCKLAPPDALARGAALIDRVGHPIVNFENPKYQYILDSS